MTSVIHDGRRLLLVAATDYDSSVAKGVNRLLHDFDELGFFNKVVMVFPFTRHNRVVSLGPELVIHEFSIPGPSLVRQALGPLQILRVIAATARLAKHETAAVIRATDPCLSGFVGLLAARLAGKPFCVSIHADFDKRHELDAAGGAPRVFGSRRLAVALERIVLSQADMVLPIRDSLIDYATKRGAPRARIKVIPHGADLSAFTSAAPSDAITRLGLPEGRPIVSFAGRLSRENYVYDVLDAARHLAKSTHSVIVAIAGGGSEEARLKEIVAQEADLARVVRFLGFQPRPLVAALRQVSSVALCPMGGFSLIEACAAGTPVVAYDAEWHRELVIDGRTGYLVAEGDAMGMGLAVERLLDDPSGSRRMGQEARALATSRHDLDIAAQNKRRCYQLLIDGTSER